MADAESPKTRIPLEELAHVAAAKSQGQRDEELARSRLSPEELREATDEWLQEMAREVSAGRLELAQRYTEHVAITRAEVNANKKVKGRRRRKEPGASPLAPRITSPSFAKIPKQAPKLTSDLNEREVAEPQMSAGLPFAPAARPSDRIRAPTPQAGGLPFKRPMATEAVPKISLATQVLPVIDDPMTEETAPDTLPPDTSPPDTSPPETLPPQTLPPQTLPPETLSPETMPPETMPPDTIIEDKHIAIPRAAALPFGQGERASAPAIDRLAGTPFKQTAKTSALLSKISLDQYAWLCGIERSGAYPIGAACESLGIPASELPQLHEVWRTWIAADRERKERFGALLARLTAPP